MTARHGHVATILEDPLEMLLSPENEHSPKIAAGGRARGVIVGSLIALGWANYGAAIFDQGVRTAVLAAAVILTAVLLYGSFALLRRIGAMPPATPAQIAAGKRKWRWFWANLAAEIVLLNIAVTLLSPPGLRIYWIAAISGVVGLHFLPMAAFFRARSYWFVGIAMMTGAAIAAVLIARHPDRATDIAYGEALANAAILWCSLGMGAVHILIERLPES